MKKITLLLGLMVSVSILQSQAADITEDEANWIPNDGVERTIVQITYPSYMHAIAKLARPFKSDLTDDIYQERPRIQAPNHILKVDVTDKEFVHKSRWAGCRLVPIVLPFNMTPLINLQVLTIDRAEVVRLPNSIGTLHNLRELNLDGTSLSQLPTSLGNLINLTTLSITGNSLTALSDTLSNLSNLITLDLSANSFHTLPSCIGGMSSLKDLSLMHNSISEIPEFLRANLSLQKLDFCNNNLKTLPKWIGELTNLQEIHLMGKNGNAGSKEKNQNIKILPLSIGRLTKLKWLWIPGNNISTLPLSIYLLKNLCNVDLENTKIKNYSLAYYAFSRSNAFLVLEKIYNQSLEKYLIIRRLTSLELDFILTQDIVVWLILPHVLNGYYTDLQLPSISEPDTEMLCEDQKTDCEEMELESLGH